MRKNFYFIVILFFCFSCYIKPVSFKTNGTDNPFFVGCFITPGEPLSLYFYPIKTLPYTANLFNVISPLSNAKVQITRKSDGAVQDLIFNNQFYENTDIDFVIAGDTYWLKIEYQNYVFSAETTVPNTSVELSYVKGIQANVDLDFGTHDNLDFRPYLELKSFSSEKQYFYLHGAYRLQILSPSGTGSYPRYYNFQTGQDNLHLFTNMSNGQPQQNFLIDRFIFRFYDTQGFLDALRHEYNIRLLITDENYYNYHRAIKSNSDAQSNSGLLFSNGHTAFSNIEGAFGVFGSFLDTPITLSSVDNPAIYTDLLKFVIQ